MQELSLNEIDAVSGADGKEFAAILGAGSGLGLAAFGTGWATTAVGIAFAASPLAVIAIAGCAGYAGYRLLTVK